MKSFFLRNREAALAAIVIVMALLVGLRAPVFLTGGNLLDVLNDSSILVILVMGQMVVLLTKGIDLSVVVQPGAHRHVLRRCRQGLPGLERGRAGTHRAGFRRLARRPERGAHHRFRLAAHRRHTGHHVSLSRRHLPAQQRCMDERSGHFTWRSRRYRVTTSLACRVWCGTPSSPCWCAGGSLRYRRAGREMYALGGNLSAAAYIGIPIKRRLMQVYAMSGALAGLSGLLWVGRYSIAFTELAAGYEMTVIAACVIGGVSTAGGIGSVLGALLGVLFTGVINGALPRHPHFTVLAAGDFRRGHSRRSGRQCPFRNDVPVNRFFLPKEPKQ